MANKYLSITSGGSILEVEATVTSAGAGDAGKVVALDAAGKIDDTLLPAGIGIDAKTYEFTETAVEGDVLNIFDDAGTAKVRLADASNGRIAHCYSAAAVTSGATGTVHFEGEVTGLTGLAPGAIQFLSGGTPGKRTETAPTTSGHYVQPLGIARDATTYDFEPGQAVVRA